MLLNMLLWLILGGLAGWLASTIMGRNAKMGILANVVIGLAGGFMAGFLAHQFGGSRIEQFDPLSLMVAVVGAVIVLAIAPMIYRGP